MMAKRAICTHLSAHILPNQSFFGNEEPGSVKRMVDIINQNIPGKKEGWIFFKQSIFCNIKWKN